MEKLGMDYTNLVNDTKKWSIVDRAGKEVQEACVQDTKIELSMSYKVSWHGQD